MYTFFFIFQFRDSMEPLPPGVETPTRVISPLLLSDDLKLMSSLSTIGFGEIINGYKQVPNISHLEVNLNKKNIFGIEHNSIFRVMQFLIY